METIYERMLDKSNTPTYEDMLSHCGELKTLFISFNYFIKENFLTDEEIKFPYGNSYGWCISHHRKTKLICNVFPEIDAFCVMVRKTDKQFADIYNYVSDYAKEIIDNRYPCNNAGWIHFHVKNDNDYSDIVRIMTGK